MNKPWHRRRNDHELWWFQYDKNGNYLNYSWETIQQANERYKRHTERRTPLTLTIIALLDLIDENARRCG